MAKIYPEINEHLSQWIHAQKIFFVATAPLSAAGHVNCSPKGADSFRLLGPRRVAYQDLTGSGVETISHLKENGRILIMFCAFDGSPQIVRLHGSGIPVLEGDQEYSELVKYFNPHVGERAIIRINVSRVSTSCGYSVPLFDYVGQRDVLDKWSVRKGAAGLAEYRKQNNSTSIDGLPGLRNG